VRNLVYNDDDEEEKIGTSYLLDHHAYLSVACELTLSVYGVSPASGREWKVSGM
jgi:hypothetical protein